jgi:hypothetical protein
MRGILSLLVPLHLGKHNPTSITFTSRSCIRNYSRINADSDEQIALIVNIIDFRYDICIIILYFIVVAK